VTSVWIESVHNLHCPRCDTRLLQRGGRFLVPERGAFMYVGEVGTLERRNGHPLPDGSVLYGYRDQRGYPRGAQVREVPDPMPPADLSGLGPRGCAR